MSWQGIQGKGDGGPARLISEGMLDRRLRQQVRPRVELPIEQTEVTAQGHQELRLVPLRLGHALYDTATGNVSVTVAGGRVKLPSGSAFDVPDTTLTITSATAGTTYWIYVDDAGAINSSTTAPGSGQLDVGTVTTPASWPASATFKGYLSQYGDLHAVDSKAAGDCWVTLADRSTYRWDGSGWVKLLAVADKRPWFIMPGGSAVARWNGTTDQTITSGFLWPLVLDSTQFNYGEFYIDPAYYNYIEVPSSGVYLVTASVRWAAGTGIRLLNISYVDEDFTTWSIGQSVVQADAARSVAHQVSAIYEFSGIAGSYILVNCQQFTGADTTILGAGGAGAYDRSRTSFSITKLR